MIDGALPYLRCPICGQPLHQEQHSLRCTRGHSFDMARQGYADLSGGRLPHVGDTAEMVADREAFLVAGHYDFIAAALAEAVPGGFVVDAGVGTGAYLARVLAAAPAATGLGVDVSKPALRRAARSHRRAAAILADVWGKLPIADASADAVLNVFAPRNGTEFHRILRPGGRLLVVTPTDEHLRELITTHGLIRVDPDKESLDEHFEPDYEDDLSRELRLTAVEARTLIGMTPSARHVPVATLPTEAVTVTAAVRLSVYSPR
jgi:23S rRNA (guanine745-N1)-methyltransferase